MSPALSRLARIIIYGALGACADAGPGPSPDHVLVSPRDADDLDPDPTVVEVVLRAAPARVVIAGVEVDALAYDGQVPGPTIRARVGDTVVVTLDNAMDQPTTLHWHGVHVPWEVDGATWQMAPVAAGDTRTITFVATHPGTFWYHPHFDSEREVDRGLYGAFVVEEAGETAASGPEVDPLVLVFDTWAERATTGPVAGGDHTHGGVDDRHRAWIVNGLSDPTYVARGGTLLHARLVNASNTGYLAVRGGGFVLVATDQGPAAAVTSPDTVVLAPGDRAELVWPIGEAGFDVVTERFSMHGGLLDGDGAGEGHDGAALTNPHARLFRVDVADPRPPPTTSPFLGTGAPSTPDPGTTDVVWVLQGSERGWLINGESFPDVTIPTVQLDTDVVIEVRNLSATRHPFHLHGMPFEVLSEGGVAPNHRVLEDTIDIPLHGVARLLVHADNPGEWMAHCHILTHAHGMMTVLRVARP